MPILKIPGAPVGKGRPRFTRTGHPYTDSKTRDYEELARKLWKIRGLPKTSGAVAVEITARFPVQKSCTKTERAAKLSGKLRPQIKPDADNIAKIILDALNGLAFDDDKDVIYLRAAKEYTDGAGEVVVSVTPFDGG